MRDAIMAVEYAFRLEGVGRATTPPKVDLSSEWLGRGWFSAMMSSLAGGICGLKWVGSFDTRALVPRVTGVMILNTPNVGLPVAVMDAAAVTSLRTGACLGVAARYLTTDRRPMSVTLIGPGRVGRSCLEALACVRPLREVRVVGRTVSKTRAFVHKMRAQLKVPVSAVSDRSDAVEGADIVVTATPADTPQFPDHMIGPGAFVASLGSHEVLEPGLLRRASMIVVDSFTQSRARGALAPLYRGEQLSDTAAVTELGAIVAGLKPGRRRWDETIVACLTGLASADVALAAQIYEAARRRKRGIVFRFLD